MRPAEAEADARARFGDVSHLAEACLWAEQTHPVREAQRLVATVLLFAVGLGAFATAFSLAWAVFHRPLRFDDADRLIRTGEGWDDARVPYPFFERLEAQGTSFEHVTAFDAAEVPVGATFDLLRVMLITEAYFDVFEVAPLVGAAPRFGEQADVWISEGLWGRRFQRNRSAVGQTLRIAGDAYAIAGVMPEAAQLSHRVDLWLRLPDRARTAESVRYIVGRLREGVTLDDARAEAVALSRGDPRVSAFYPLKRIYATPVRPAVWIGLTVAVLVLGLVAVAALWRAWRRAQLAVRFGTTPDDLPLQLGLAVAAALGGLGIARALQAPLYDGLLGRWGPMFDRSIDAPVVFAVLAVGLALGVLAALGTRWGARHAAARVGG